jgi:hypothetical protein
MMGLEEQGGNDGHGSLTLQVSRRPGGPGRSESATGTEMLCIRHLHRNCPGYIYVFGNGQLFLRLEGDL